MKVAIGVLVSMTVLSLSGYIPTGGIWAGPYALSGGCVVRLSRVFARGLARVLRAATELIGCTGKRPRHGADVPRGARLRPRAAGLGKGATPLRWRWSRGSHRADSDRPG